MTEREALAAEAARKVGLLTGPGLDYINGLMNEILAEGEAAYFESRLRRRRA